ncbi:hypothetical protein PGT21_028393 [Puccinia graminis f. sp. tritici]|nr:hypothetical protein PGT21_029222 [Puccinia graminis f. sp. tritici]KAA1101711.1 hypothetical protein PGT21_028393 [Puccinia graminis f. sp. tritici]KAA1136263.1 hypothetical protein PGTUg99_014850 [Puccinia graminis f. sp. tritici]
MNFAMCVLAASMLAVSVQATQGNDGNMPSLPFKCTAIVSYTQGVCIAQTGSGTYLAWTNRGFPSAKVMLLCCCAAVFAARFCHTALV